MYLNTRDYVNKKIVKPVLMRAGSVKQIGSQAANAAADRLDGALTVADKYVDRYLPADPTDKDGKYDDMSEILNSTKFRECNKLRLFYAFNFHFVELNNDSSATCITQSDINDIILMYIKH